MRAALAACVIVTVGVVVAPAAHATTANAPVVAFVGDSNEMLAMPDVNAELPPEFAPIDVTQPGTGIRGLRCPPNPCDPNWWETKLDATPGAADADAYVVDLGINDTLSPGDATTVGYSHYPMKIDWLMRLFGNKPVFWSNLPCEIEPPDRQTGCAIVNWTLAMATLRWPNLTILRWRMVAIQHPEWIAGSFGNIHLWPAGQQAWTSLVQQALEQKFGVLPSP